MTSIRTEDKRHKEVELTPEELDAVDEGLRSEKTERIYAAEEALAYVLEKRKEWMKSESSQ